MAQLISGEYNPTKTELQAVAGQYKKLQVDNVGNLLTYGASRFRESNQFVAGALSTTGKIGTVAASATTIVAVDCTDFPTMWVDWAVDFDNSWSYQLCRANSNPLAGTITFADATAVDADDTFVFNGVTWTAKASGAVAASHQWNLGANNAEAAANLAAALSGTYGPGVTCTVEAVAATDVITVRGTTATVLQFAQGTSDANEIAWAETSKLYLDKQGAEVTGKTTTAAWNAEAIQNHYIDGWGWAAIVIDNDEASTATLEVRAVRY